MFARDYDESPITEEEFFTTPFRTKKTEILRKKDSLNNIVIKKVTLDSLIANDIVYQDDTISVQPTPIDINNYLFEEERIKILNQEFKEKKINIQVVEREDKPEPRALIYQKAFYQNFLTSQVDFSFLSNMYQSFNGSAVYYNPGMNLQLKVGTYDLFEDYKVTAGFRLPLDFSSYEYLISLENLKNRLNKQLVFHRQSYLTETSDDDELEIRNITHQIFGVIRYPFSQVTSVSLTVGGRSDKTIFLPLGSDPGTTLLKENEENLWGNAKVEYVFDNTRSLGINLPAGSRFKIFGEVYQKATPNYDNLFVIGADFRNYMVIHRNLIWANRFATSSSFGSAGLIYYLGGVDNWTNLSSKYPTFIPLSEIRITSGKNYAFQTVATNMRGFSQNIRNGSNFALINSEIRWPIIRYFANYPLSNAFLENLQAIGFVDIGTAWTGLSPWSKKNGYDTDIVEGSSIEIEIDAQRDPIVAGYGFGVRSQLLGYFVRLDWAWGIENQHVQPRMFYFSLSLDF